MCWGLNQGNDAAEFWDCQPKSIHENYILYKEMKSEIMVVNRKNVYSVSQVRYITIYGIKLKLFYLLFLIVVTLYYSPEPYIFQL